MKPKALSAKQLNIIRGKMLVEHPSPQHPIWQVIGYIDWLETKLDEVDYDDTFGTEGWRHHFGHPDEGV